MCIGKPCGVILLQLSFLLAYLNILHMSHSLKSLKRVIWEIIYRTLVGVIRRDARS